MKLPGETSLDNFNEDSIDTSRMNDRTSSRNGRTSNMNGGRRTKVEPISETNASVPNQNGKSSSEPANRLLSMKKVANEQRVKVRETRGKLLEEERSAAQAKRQEELRSQIRITLDSLVPGIRSDVIAVLEQRIDDEKGRITEQIKNDLFDSNSTLAREVHKKVAGEPLESRVAKLKKDYENTYHKLLRTQLTVVQSDILSDLEEKIEHAKRTWESEFKNEAIKRVKASENAIRTDFRVGLEDSQKHCDEILSSMQERTSSLEQKLTNQIAVMDAEAIAAMQESERKVCQHIIDRLDTRDKTFRELIRTETEGLQKEVTRVRKDLSPKSKCCVII